MSVCGCVCMVGERVSERICVFVTVVGERTCVPVNVHSITIVP